MTHRRGEDEGPAYAYPALAATGAGAHPVGDTLYSRARIRPSAIGTADNPAPASGCAFESAAYAGLRGPPQAPWSLRGFGSKPETGREERRTQPGNQLAGGVLCIAPALVARVTVKAGRSARPARGLVSASCVAGIRVLEGLKGAPPHIIGIGGVATRRQSCDLLEVEGGADSHERNVALFLIACAGVNFRTLCPRAGTARGRPVPDPIRARLVRPAGADSTIDSARRAA